MEYKNINVKYKLLEINEPSCAEAMLLNGGGGVVG
jgi:hypothetical protein